MVVSLKSEHVVTYSSLAQPTDGEVEQEAPSRHVHHMPRVVASLATAFVGSFRKGGSRLSESLPDTLATFANVIEGQVNGNYPKETIAKHRHHSKINHLGAGRLEGRPIGETFATCSSVKKHLRVGMQGKVTFQSLLPESQRQKIGLLRSPSLDESALQSSDYNIDMANSALKLGAAIRRQFSAGYCPDFNALWEVCRDWRVGRLATHSNLEEMIRFSSARQLHNGVSATGIQKDVFAYAHLLELLRSQFNKQPPIAAGQTTLVSLSHSMIVQGVVVPLTEIRAMFDADAEIVEHSLDTEYVYLQISEGAMIHTGVEYLDFFYIELHEKVHELAALFKGGDFRGATQLLVSNNPKESQFADAVALLADIHYLLAQGMLDRRGSAAKSELLVRGLAAAVGLELPPFRQGFVPDLEAFLVSRASFVQSYADAFETAEIR